MNNADQIVRIHPLPVRQALQLMRVERGGAVPPRASMLPLVRIRPVPLIRPVCLIPMPDCASCCQFPSVCGLTRSGTRSLKSRSARAPENLPGISPNYPISPTSHSRARTTGRTGQTESPQGWASIPANAGRVLGRARGRGSCFLQAVCRLSVTTVRGKEPVLRANGAG